MARYSVSDKNRYGFRDGLYQTMAWMVLAFIAVGLVTELLAGPLFYSLYREENTLGLGEVGNLPELDTPGAESIADMERLGRFTLVTTGTVLKYDTINDQGTIYHRLTLPSGERVVARINQKALQETDQAGVYRLPVGCWREWEAPEKVMVFSGLLVTSHYVDMYGDYRALLPEWEFGHALGMQMGILAFLAAGFYHRFSGVRQGRFAPIFLDKTDPLLPKNDLELWCASTYALPLRALPGAEGWPLITRCHRTRSEVEKTKAALAGEWGVYDAAQGIEAVHRLSEPWSWGDGPEGGNAAWDLCRANQLLGMLYHAGMLDRNTLNQEFSRVGKVIQQRFSSWQELTDEYWAGCPARARPYLEDLLLDLRTQRWGPYSIPWRTALSWSPEGESGEEQEVKKILGQYRRTF